MKMGWVKTETTLSDFVIWLVPIRAETRNVFINGFILASRYMWV